MNAQEFMLSVADDLNVTPRPLEYVTDLPGTMMGALQKDMNAIFIKDGIRGGLDENLVIAHEMRHIWQRENDTLHRVKSRGDTNLLEYNEQSHEVDANAYATVMILLCCGKIVLWKGLDETVRVAIWMRAVEMLESRGLPSDPILELIEKTSEGGQLNG